MDDIVKIKCPGCGSILPVRNQPDLEKKSVTCPVCKKKSRIADCQKIKEQKEDDATQYRFDSKNNDEEERTTLNREYTVPLGRLVNMQTGSVHRLSLGKNTIGRKVAEPLPSVTIAIEETQTKNSMSREHAVIEVTRLANGSYRHFLSNWNNKNATSVNGRPLVEADRIVLSGEEIIKMGQVSVRFEIQ